MRRFLAFIVIAALLTAILGTAYAYDYSFTSQLLRYSDSSAYELIASSEMRLTFVALIIMELLADGRGEFSDLLAKDLFPDTIVFLDESGQIPTAAFAFNNNKTSIHAAYAPNANKIHVIQLPFNNTYETLEGDAKILGGWFIRTVDIVDVITVLSEILDE